MMIRPLVTRFALAALFACAVLPLAAQQTCYFRRDGDTLTMGNALIERRFVWNDGNLMTVDLRDKAHAKSFASVTLRPDFSLTDKAPKATGGDVRTETVAATAIRPAHLKVEVSFTLGALDVRRVYRLWDDVPAIACDTYLRGVADMTTSAAQGDAYRNIESTAAMQTKLDAAVLDRVQLAGQHWRARAVEFWDVTDWNNNLVAVRDVIPYRKTTYRGNLFFVRDGVDDAGIFFLKEAPSSAVQLEYKGDFVGEFGNMAVIGPGISARDITPDAWTRTYGCVTGVYGPGELAALKALRSYQKQQRTHVAGRDEMVMMNTWGDRSQDKKVNEAFCLNELERAAKLGMTHFQIDDGWQTGKSPNSAVAKGSFSNIWSRDDYWSPDTLKYPRGLAPVVQRGRELGIEVCVWFNPSVQNDFADWRRDATTIVELWRKYGIRTFKIDGLSIPTKQAEINLRRLFDAVLAESNNEVIFNLDATAGRRAGYHTFNEYGNIFLENRYTDWQNYYPYWTLRNVWMLSKYVPAERLQVEFLNKWRNAAKYGDEPYAPARYSFDYLFATTMAGQPLAWFEASQLPDEAFSVAPLIDAYKLVSEKFHHGVILPIGEEPSGRSWTGFQSLTDDTHGYLIVYRELTPTATASIDTWFEEGSTVAFRPVLGNGKAFKAKVGPRGAISVSLPSQNDFAMYEYEIK